MFFNRIAPVLLALWGVGFLTSLCFAQRGPGGPGRMGPDTPDVLLVKKYDLDHNGRLDAEERAEARKAVQRGADRQGPRPRVGERGRAAREGGKPGEKVAKDAVAAYPESDAYEPDVLRTLFLEFESADWESELADFKTTDVLVPAKLFVDGKDLAEVGVSFRGASSFFMVPAGLKRSLNLSLDWVDKDQRLGGVKTLNLLNCNGDESMLSSVLYSSFARKHLPAPRANFVKVVINGESWGVYCNVEQFNKDFLKRNFGNDAGARWKVSGSPRADGGLRYLGADIAPYRERFEIKSKDEETSWKALIQLCKVLDETPASEIEAALAPLLDLDGALWFLAYDVVFCNSDGYWARASDYSLYLDPTGMFHIVPHDMNEAFQDGHGAGPGGPPGGGRGRPEGGFPGFEGPPDGEGRPGLGGPPDSEQAPGVGGSLEADGPPENRPQTGQGEGPGRRQRGGPGGGPRGGGVNLDPLVGLQDASKPLRSKLLANERLRTIYLQHVRAIATDVLDWNVLGAEVARARALLFNEVAKDTRKLGTTEGFLAATAPELAETQAAAPSLRSFAEKRRAHLLGLESIKNLPEAPIRLAEVQGTDSDKHESSPGARWPHIESALRINEVMAVAMEEAAGNKQAATDWIEITNVGKAPIDLQGHYLSDDPQDPTKWSFPSGVILAPGAYLLVWADNAKDASKLEGLHANFKLSNKGEHLVLASQGAILADFAYPKQRRGQSYGSLEGVGSFMTPTPGAPNRALPALK